jgi:hypothetical protein
VMLWRGCGGTGRCPHDTGEAEVTRLRARRALP